MGKRMMPAAPVPLTKEHAVAGFTCGIPSLDTWLETRAFKNQMTGASRTYVVCEGARVVAYHALAAGAVAISAAPGAFRRNMPDPIPIVVLGRLAVDTPHQGLGYGRALVRDAACRVGHHRHSRDDRPCAVTASQSFLRVRGLRAVPAGSHDLDDHDGRPEGVSVTQKPEGVSTDLPLVKKK